MKKLLLFITLTGIVSFACLPVGTVNAQTLNVPSRQITAMSGSQFA